MQTLEHTGHGWHPAQTARYQSDFGDTGGSASRVERGRSAPGSRRLRPRVAGTRSLLSGVYFHKPKPFCLSSATRKTVSYLKGHTFIFFLSY